MLRKFVFTLVLIVSANFVNACLPRNVMAVNFTNNEPVNLSAIEKLGKAGVNYFVNSDLTLYTYRCHYDNSIMISLTDRRVGFTVDMSKITAGNTFLPGKIVRTELDWLFDVGVIFMDSTLREKIGNDFAKNIGCIYWTKHDTILPPDRVMGDNGSIGYPDCKDENDAVINLPSEELGASSLIKKNPSFKKQTANFNTAKTFFVNINGQKLKTAVNSASNKTASNVLIQFDSFTGKAVKRIVSVEK